VLNLQQKEIPWHMWIVPPNHNFRKSLPWQYEFYRIGVRTKRASWRRTGCFKGTRLYGRPVNAGSRDGWKPLEQPQGNAQMTVWAIAAAIKAARWSPALASSIFKSRRTGRGSFPPSSLNAISAVRRRCSSDNRKLTIRDHRIVTTLRRVCCSGRSEGDRPASANW